MDVVRLFIMVVGVSRDWGINGCEAYLVLGLLLLLLVRILLLLVACCYFISTVALESSLLLLLLTLLAGENCPKTIFPLSLSTLLLLTNKGSLANSPTIALLIIYLNF
jgi:hypothetical protein